MTLGPIQEALDLHGQTQPLGTRHLHQVHHTGPSQRRLGRDVADPGGSELHKGRIVVRGKLVTRGQRKRPDYILYWKPNIPLALLEAKDNTRSVGDGIQQSLDHAETLNIPFVFSSNGDGFVFHDRTGVSTPRETTLSLDAFPAPTDLWAWFRAWKGLDGDAEPIVLEDFYDDGSGKAPRYD